MTVPTFNTLQPLTLSLAVLGAVLGIINTWHGLDKSRLKLKITPKHAIPVGGADPRIKFCVEVTNLSAFAVTIEDVGILYSGTKNRGSITVTPLIIDGGSWPRRLEARSSVTVYSEQPTSEPGHKITKAYAKTQCGYTRTGRTPALKQIAREAERH
jgi:hypothetical protein